MAEFRLGAQIINDGAVIRIEKDGKILLVAKDQVKTIDTVHDNIVRIDIGVEAPIKLTTSGRGKLTTCFAGEDLVVQVCQC